tara:strand:- start:1330 stop:1614 length:285 start_codon:yes stop_codon:yes gene_type:complete
MKNKSTDHGRKSGTSEAEIEPFIPDGPKYKPSKAERKLNKKLGSKKDAQRDYKRLLADEKRKKKDVDRDKKLDDLFNKVKAEKKFGTGNHPLNR